MKKLISKAPIAKVAILVAGVACLAGAREATTPGASGQTSATTTASTTTAPDPVQVAQFKIKTYKRALLKYTAELEALRRQKPQPPPGDATDHQRKNYQDALAAWQMKVSDLETRIKDTKQKLAAAEQELAAALAPQTPPQGRGAAP